MKNQLNKFRRTLALGDVHGNAKALDQVLERSAFDLAQDRLISLGDLVDYNPENMRVFEILMGIPNLVALRGNHDQLAYDFLVYGESDPVWIMNGGVQTRREFDAASESQQDAVRQFLAKQKKYFVDEENRLYVHASILHDLPMEHQKDAELLWGRSLWKKAIAWHNQKDDYPDNEFEEIFIGHTQTIELDKDCKPVNIGNIWNLDQGAKGYGKLTLMDVASKEYWQSDWTIYLYDNID